jgi:S1-C subfamily serine protease
MKLCQSCGQLLAEDINTCPSCGSQVAEGKKAIDDYHIIEVLHEGYATILCHAVKKQTAEPAMIRIFTPHSGVDEKIADRLKNELEEIHKLPEEYFVRHFEIRKSSDGLWYRISEWLDTENWGNLIASGVFQDYKVAFRLFRRIALILDGLHRTGHFIPHLILDDILVIKGGNEELQVKIDYKLSRFLDPKLDRPGPTLKKLLSCHPDILQQRPLNLQSDIWSLGKIFVELLTAEHQSDDFQAEIDTLTLPPEIEVLLKAMLADDPSLRPQSMAEVVESLARVKEEDIEAAMRRRREAMQPPVQEIRSLKRRIGQLVLIIGIAAVLAVMAWFFFVYRQKDPDKIFGAYANRYAKSVAFVLTEYWLSSGQTRLYQNRGEGTAFLVDRSGYLLTNRHVACPWLEDGNLLLQIQRHLGDGNPLELGYRIFLWFEGAKAFERLPGLSQSTELEDIYSLAAAYRTDGTPHVEIVGVARSPDRTRLLIQSPLKDDFAVLKIDPVPQDLPPLPLDENMQALKVPKLSPVIALGFPLGSRTQEASVNVSVTQGHVRRTFENLLQVDTSLHRGNSGGPIIDIDGKVIGIASGVAIEWAAAPIPVATLQSDMGMVLPINKAAIFLQQLKAGNVKWNGVPDLSVDAKIKFILDLAEEERWSEAQALADRELQKSFDPTLVLAAAMIHFCAGDYQRAGSLFEKALSLDEENDQARWMLFLIDWLSDPSVTSPHRQELRVLDWRSPHELFGYLVRVLEGGITEQSALRAGYTDAERNWLRYVVALMAGRQNNPPKAEMLLRQAALTTGRENWLHFLALSRLAQIRQQKMAGFQDPADRRQYQADLDRFAAQLAESDRELTQRQSHLAPLRARLSQGSLDAETKRTLLKQILEIDPGDDGLRVELAFYCAVNEDWDEALQYAGSFLALDGRESAGRLRAGLLVPEILNAAGRAEEARAALETYLNTTQDGWYRLIAECLLNRQKETPLAGRIAESPEFMLTGYTALGFWAEGAGDKKKAIEYYREALGSYMDDMIEYAFAAERIKRLRNASR